MWIFSGTTQWIYLLLKGGGGGGGGWKGFRFEIQRRSQVVFKVIKRSDIQILLKDLKGKMRGERLEIITGHYFSTKVRELLLLYRLCKYEKRWLY